MIIKLITSYKPQVVNADVIASYTDSSGNTISATIHHPGIAMSLADLDNNLFACGSGRNFTLFRYADGKSEILKPGDTFFGRGRSWLSNSARL